MLSRIVMLVRSALQRRRVRREVDEELEHHLAMETDANIRSGMDPDAARRKAQADFGGVVQTKEAIADVRRFGIEAVWLDARYAARALRKRAGLSALVVATLALGIGVNTVALAMGYGILVRPLPYRDPSNIVILNLLFRDGGDLGFSPDTLQQYVSRLRTVERAAGYYRRDVTVRSSTGSFVVPAAVVTDGFFDVLKAAPPFTVAGPDLQSKTVVVDQRTAQAVLGSVQPVAGVPIVVSEEPYTLGAVMPAGFGFPDAETGIWLPSQVLTPGIEADQTGYSRIVARLRPGVTVARLRADVNRVKQQLDRTNATRVSVVVLGESAVADVRGGLVAAVIAAGLVLLVACANVATLFVGWNVARRRQLAAQMALGATRMRLVRSAIAETGLLAVIATGVGLLLGGVMLRILINIGADSVPGLQRVGIDPTTVVFVAALTALVAVTCGAIPMWYVTRDEFAPFLRSTANAAPAAWRLRRCLVIAQIACAVVLLIGAGLLARTVYALTTADHGFEPDGAIEAKLVLSDTALMEDASRQQFVGTLLDRVRGMPGVQYAGFGTNLPPRTPSLSLVMRLVDGNRDESRFMNVGAATPGYLRALGARFLAGRDFDEGSAENDVILSESIARFYFPAASAVGQTIFPLPPMFNLPGRPHVIGVVADMKYNGLDSPAGGAIYIPWTRRPLGTGYLIVRAPNSAPGLMTDIRRLARTIDPAVPIAELLAMDEVIERSIGSRTFRAVPAVAFGLLALAVASAGLLATLSTLVVERRRDLAIRSAVGAKPAQVVCLIVRQGMMLTAAGLIVGLLAGIATARGLRSMIYGVSPYDSATFLTTAGAIGLATILMACLAAMRATNIDIVSVLKSE